MYMPTWMMQNIGLKNGNKVEVKSVSKVPQGQFIRLQPHNMSFVEAMEEMGPRCAVDLSFTRSLL
jgi:hypothetical protein